MVDIKLLTPIIAIVCLAVLEAIALMQNIDGTLLSVVVAAIAGIGGYVGKGQVQAQKKVETPSED